jgi:hypothetical protein
MNLLPVLRIARLCIAPFVILLLDGVRVMYN